jgi:peroxiredoxin Q/BCP
MALTIGSSVPITEIIDSAGVKHSLLGSKTVLYFYPKDNTPGCTAQACNLNENLDYLMSKGYKVIGASVDSTKSHDKFIAKFQLKFPLISDESHNIVEAFGVWVEKSMYGKSYMGIARTTFLIDEMGIIIDIITKVDTQNHTQQIH